MAPVTTSRSKRPDRTISRLYNASQLRVDTWTKLKYAVESLGEKGRTRADVKRLRGEIEEALELLDPMESYFAFPGTATFRRIPALLENDDLVTLRRLVVRIVGALIGNTYRRHPVSLDTWAENAAEHHEPDPLKEAGEDGTPKTAVPRRPTSTRVPAPR